MTPIKLYARLPSGRYRAATYCEIRDALAASNLETARNELVGKTITGPSDAAPFLIEALRHQTSEVFAAIWMDTRHRVIAFDELFRGTIDGAPVFSREAVRRALSINAASVIISHGHPSGVAEPSHADERITKRLRDAFDLVDIRLLDHIVVGDGTSTSLASRGLC